jgi:hypothetical protein
MRPRSAMPAIAAVLFAMTLTAAAVAENKSITYVVNTGTTLSKVNRTSDQPDHKVVSTLRRGMTSSGDRDWDGAAFVNYGTSDFSGGTGTVSGFTFRTHRNGDQTYYLYQGRLKVVGEGDPPLTVGEGTVELVGGTGKFAKAKGSGTWASEKGQSTIKLDLEY